jgi:hypothetical protein
MPVAGRDGAQVVVNQVEDTRCGVLGQWASTVPTVVRMVVRRWLGVVAAGKYWPAGLAEPTGTADTEMSTLLTSG